MKLLLYCVVYSCLTLALFFAFLYLMTVVDPGLKELPARIRMREIEEETLLADNIYPKDAPPNDDIDYGLEKIPEDVDANEFRKQMMTTVTKYNIDMDKSSYERTQRVVPPIWPNERRVNIEEDVNKVKNQTVPKIVFETSSPVKGLRRSVSNDTPQYQNENPGSVLLKIIDDAGRKKIEIKFISREKGPTKKIKQISSNKQESNGTLKELANPNQSGILNITEDAKDNVIQIKSDDVILLTIVNDSGAIVSDSNNVETENTVETPKFMMNISETGSYLNKTIENFTNGELYKAGKEKYTSKEMYTVTWSKYTNISAVN